MRTALLLGLGLAMIAGCDDPPGPALPIGRAPVVSDFQLAPSQVDLADVDPSAISNGIVSIEISVAARVEPGAGSLEDVRYVVRRPDRATDAVAEGVLSVQSGGVYAATFEVRLPTGSVGNYPVAVYAVDDRGRMSNQVTAMLRYRASGSRPVIEEVVAPEVIQRPSEGERPVQFVAVVSDPDGLANIERVVFWNVNSPGALIEMFDDGGAESGDEEAGDGRYTRTLTISSTNQPGTNTFAFQARDLTGLESDIVEINVTIE